MTITLKQPGDLIDAIPAVLGFAPADSWVVLGLPGPTARVDLPGSTFGIAETISAVLDPFKMHGITRVMFAVYTDDETLADEMLFEARQSFIHAGIEVLDSVHIVGNTWRLAGESRTWRRNSEEPWHSTVGASSPEATGDLPCPARSREALGHIFTPEPHHLTPTEASEPVTDRTAFEILGEDSCSNEIIAHVMLRLASEGYAADMVETLTRDNAREHLTVWSRVVRHAHGGTEAYDEAAGLCALAAWTLGTGALAWVAHDLAPDARLSQLVNQLCSDAVHPDQWEQMRPAVANVLREL